MISIIIPTYKPQDYLWQCLDSFVAQTLDKQRWELIIVLNGCNEPWSEMIDIYLHAHSLTNARVIQTDEAGVSNARNIGIDAANGEYIGFVDDDDYVSPTYLEELARIASPNTIAASYTVAFDETRSFIPYYIEAAYQVYSPQGTIPYYKARKYFSGPCMKLFHRDIIGDCRFDTRFKVGEDALFMYLISNRMHQIAFTSIQAIYYRRMRTDSASHASSKWQTIHNCIRLMHQYSRIYLKGHGYAFSFYLTRLLGAIHTIISQ